MGAWGSLERALGLARPSHIQWDYIGRSRRASPSEGYAGSHQLEQERIVTDAFATSRRAGTGHLPPSPRPPRPRHDPARRGARRWTRRRCRRASRRATGCGGDAYRTRRIGRNLPELGVHSHQVVARGSRLAAQDPRRRLVRHSRPRTRGGFPADDGTQGRGRAHHAQGRRGCLQAAWRESGSRPGRGRRRRGGHRRGAPRVRSPHRLRRHRAIGAARHRHGASRAWSRPTAFSGWSVSPTTCS